MGNVNISLPDELRAFVEKEVAAHGYQSTGEYLRDLIRRQRDRENLKSLLMEGATSPVKGEFDKKWFDGLRNQVRSRRKQ